ncbi:MAG: FAD-dependent oxidoreductase [Gammaproteobacteria bacterium]|nr:MAG: FAD-dependent oxidoreductase [Gammaproteobacteria bacterium]
MNQRLPGHAATVVIGGGVVGCSIAYHLAKAGQKDVVLLERSRLSAGTTWHSAGNMETYRADPLIFEIVRYGVSLFPELEKESEQALGWRTTGRVMYTHLPARMAAYRSVPRLAHARGIEVELLDARKLEQRFPILDVSPILGGLWIPNDGRVNPTDLTMAYARAARRRGATLLENCAVQRIRSANDRVQAVETTIGEIRCDNVVVAAGLWSSDITSTCGVPLPLYALEHFYLITKEMPEVPRDLPMFLAFDDYLYGREEVGGLIVGCLDRDALPIATRDLPSDFSFGLLNERWDQFEPYMSTALQRFPALERAEIRMLLNGPESFTPDGQMIIGPVPPVAGLFVAAGMSSNGIALSAGVGRIMAEWIVAGRPDLDVSRLDVRRFARCQASESFMRRRATEIPSYCIEMHGPGDDYRTARDVRLSPLHEYLAERGAHFRSICGWERASWVDRDGRELSPRTLVDEEIAATERDVLAIDGSMNSKFLINGDGAAAAITELFGAASVPIVGEATTVLADDGCGAIVALASLARLAESVWLLSAEAEQETSFREWIRVRLQQPHVSVRDITAEYALVRLLGRRRERVIREVLVPANGLCGSMPASCWRDRTAAVDALLVPKGMALELARQLESLAVPWGGHFAEEANRIRRGRPAFGRELSAFTDVPAADFRCFSGRAVGPANPGHRAVMGTIDCDPGLDSGLEPVFSSELPVGWLTSAAWIRSQGSSVVMARVAAAHAGARLQVLVGDELVPLRPRES